jgi:hypothetical protein
MVCTGYNSYITSLIMKQQLLWKLTLDDGSEVWSDFDLPGVPDPWTRAKQYLKAVERKVVRVSAIAPGQPEMPVLENPDGLTGFFIMRGSAKSINDTEETVYCFLSFAKLEEDGLLHVKKFFWPECSLLESEEIRELTPENKSLLYG